MPFDPYQGRDAPQFWDKLEDQLREEVIRLRRLPLRRLIVRLQMVAGLVTRPARLAYRYALGHAIAGAIVVIAVMIPLTIQPVGYSSVSVTTQLRDTVITAPDLGRVRVDRSPVDPEVLHAELAAEGFEVVIRKLYVTDLDLDGVVLSLEHPGVAGSSAKSVVFVKIGQALSGGDSLAV